MRLILARFVQVDKNEAQILAVYYFIVIVYCQTEMKIGSIGRATCYGEV